MFCCGCSPATGVLLVLACHFIACILQLASICSNVIWKTPLLFEHSSTSGQLFVAGLCLIGIPVIIAAFFGVTKRIETNIRLYLYYLFVCFAIDTAAVLYFCLVQDICDSETFEEVLDGDTGESFMCGISRILTFLFVAATICLEVYVLWLVWSLCEDVHLGTNGPELSVLIPGKDDILQKNRRPQDGPYAGIVGFAHTKVPGPYPYPDRNAYGSTLGMPGQPTMFGGTYHETAYPPSKESAAF